MYHTRAHVDQYVPYATIRYNMYHRVQDYHFKHIGDYEFLFGEQLIKNHVYAIY